MLFEQKSVKEICSRRIDFVPHIMAEEAVNLVRDDQKFDVCFPQPSQPLDDIGGLDEINIPVIIPVDEKHWGGPKFNVCHWR